MFELFAQMNNRGGANNNFGGGGAGAGGAGGGADDAFLIAMIAVVGVMLIVSLAIAILFLLTLSKCLKRCDPRNRTMEPGQVWLNLIPCFSIVWQFITVTRIEETLQREFRDRGYPRQSDYGKGTGMTYCVCNLLNFVPIVSYVSSLVGLICFIIYWVKIAGHSKELAEGPSYRNDRTRLDDDDYDDRNDRRGGRDPYDDDRRDPPRGGHYDEQRDDPDDKPWRR